MVPDRLGSHDQRNFEAATTFAGRPTYATEDFPSGYVPLSESFALPQTQVHQTSVTARPTTPPRSPTKRRRLNVSAALQPSSQDDASINTQAAESDHGGNQFDEPNPRLSNITNSSIFSQNVFPTPGFCDVTQVVNYDQAGCGFNDINQLLGEGLYFNIYPPRRQVADPEGYGFSDVTHAVQDYTPQNTFFC
jgi:hypothetical protein